jgi:hypothetical protein
MPGQTAAQICSLARQAAKCPGYSAQSGQLLNMILAELCQDFDFQIARGTYRFNFNPGLTTVVGGTAAGSGPYSLPSDFLRCEGPMSVFYTISNVPYPLIPCDLSQIDMMVQQAGLQAFPCIFATDLSQQDFQAEGAAAPQAYVWPPPSGTFPVTVRYFRQMPAIDTPETSAAVPWFPNQSYLITRLTGELMNLTDDARAATFLSETPDHSGMGAPDLLARYLKLKDDSSNRAKSVTLDRRQFGRGSYSRLPNTKLVGW